MSVKLTYINDDFQFSYQGHDYTCIVEAEATYWYDHGCMYMRNGDPGYPPEEDFEIDKTDISGIMLIDDDFNTVELEDKSIIPALEDEVVDCLYKMDLNRWSGFDDEPEQEDPWED